MDMLRSVVTRVFRGDDSKRHAKQICLCVMLALLWCYFTSSTTISIHIETRQKNPHASTVIKEDNDARGETTIRTETSFFENTAVDDTFQLENLDTSKRVPCGANKCFFQLKTDVTVGYLVQPDVFRYDTNTSPDELFKTLEVSWEFAEQLRRNHGIKHFLLEAPTKIQIDKGLAKQLNSNIWSEARGVQYDTDRFREGSTAFIQKVRLAPKPNLIIGCTASKREQFKRNAGAFLAQVNDKKGFARHFAENMKSARSILDSEPCLFKDFQLLLHTDGELFHLDFDRCFSSRGAEKKRTERKSRIHRCLKEMDNVESQITKILSGKAGESIRSSSSSSSSK